MNSTPSRPRVTQFRRGDVEAPLAGRRATIAALACWIAAPMSLVAHAQQKPAKVYRMGILAAGPRVRRRFHEALRDNLRELNWVEGKNLVIEERFAEGNYELMPKLASELVALRLDVIVAQGTPATLAAKNATTTIPIVMTGAGDAAAMGIVASLARPGGNVTGMTIYSPELFAKRIELMKEALPQIRQVAVWLNPANPAQERSFHAGEKVAKVLKLELRRFELRSVQEFASVLASMAQQRVDALILSNDTVFNTNARTIAELAIKHRLPVIGPNVFSAAGALMSYGVLSSETDRRVAYFVDRILKGAKPADLPVELPTRFEFVVNLKTAKALGVSMPTLILARADRVIE